MSNVVLKHLDEPVRFLSFSIGDLVAYSAPFFVGSLFDSLFVIPVIGITVVLIAKKLLKRVPKNQGVRFLYWTLPTSNFNRVLQVNMPPSHKQFWVS